MTAESAQDESALPQSGTEANIDSQGKKNITKSDSRLDRRLLLLVALVGVLVYLPLLGCFGPTDPTDSFFLESGREMIETGQYLLPLNNYEHWLDKPILFFWMVVASYKLFGVNAFVGRLPAALSAVATGLVIYHSTRGILRPASAALAACIFLGLPLASMVGHQCLTDMTLTLLISGTVLYLFRGWLEGSTKYIVVGYLFNALGFLCKGPIASILAAATLVLFFLLSGRSLGFVWRGIRDLKPLLGIVIACVINVPWYAAAIQATNGKFFEAFFLQQNFGRMMGTVNHQMPFWFYVPVFFGGFFPWCLLTVSVPSLFRKGIQVQDRANSKRVALFRLALCWFGIVIVLFTVVKTKLPTYILPAAPAFAILVVLQMEFGLKKSKRLLALAGVAVVCALLGAIAAQPLLPKYLKPVVIENGGLAIFLACLAGFSLISLSKGRKTVCLHALTATMLIACSIFVPLWLKAFHDSRQIGFNRLVTIARDAGATTAIISAEEPMMPYILHQHVYRLQLLPDAEKFTKTGKEPHYVLIPSEVIARLDWFPGGNRLLDQEGKWSVYEVFAPKQ